MNSELLLFLKQHRPKPIDEPGCFRSAVCLPLLPRSDGGFDLLFEVRSSRIADQPGDVCFPGGAIEAGESPETAAVRELCEELLVPSANVQILGESDYLHYGGLTVYAFPVLLENYAGSFSPDEVADVFTVPLEKLLTAEPEAYPTELVTEMPADFPYDRIQGGKNYRWRRQRRTQYFYDAGGHCIWGITAKLLRAFLLQWKRKK